MVYRGGDRLSQWDAKKPTHAAFALEKPGTSIEKRGSPNAAFGILIK
jgi:hypothetical protein